MMQTAKLIKTARFDFGDRVEYDNKIGKDDGIVTGLSLRPNGITYCIAWSNKSESWHYEYELKKKP